MQLIIFLCFYQESIPTLTAERVKETMLEGVENALGLAKTTLKRPFYTRVQLWYKNDIHGYYLLLCIKLLVHT